MQIKFYCDLHVSECWHEKKGKIVKRLKANRIQPEVHVVALAQGRQNELELFSSILLEQHIFDNAEIFIVGIADGYDEALLMIRDIAEEVYNASGDADIRTYILKRQEEYERQGGR